MCPRGVESLPARKGPLPMDTGPSDHSLCPAVRFSAFLLLLSKGNLFNTEALKKAERSARIQMASCPLAADVKAMSVLRLRTWPAFSWVRAMLPASAIECRTSLQVAWLVFL